MASRPITSRNVDGKTMEKVTDFIFLGPQITADGDYGHEFKRHLLLWRQRFVYDRPSQHSKKQRHYFANKGPFSQSYGFSSGHVWMWELDHKEGWTPKNWCFWTMVLEKTPESPLDCKEIKPVNPKGNQSWYSLEGLMLKLKHQYIDHLMQRTDSLEKPLRLVKIEGRRRRGLGWDGWMASSTRWTWICASSESWWWTKESDTSEWLNWTEIE